MVSTSCPLKFSILFLVFITQVIVFYRFEKSPDLDELCNSCNGLVYGFAVSSFGTLGGI
jgi:hypothetical protein